MASAYQPVLWLLLLASSNLALVNQRLAVRSQDGVNLFGIRDFLLITALIIGWPKRDQWTAWVGRQRLVRVPIPLMLWAIPSALIGMQAGAQWRDLLYEVAALVSWLLLFVVAANVRSAEDVSRAARVLLVLGVLVSVGVLGEVVLRRPIVTGSSTMGTLHAASIFLRPTPSCWAVMIVALSLLLAALIDRSWGLLRIAGAGLLVAVIIIASFATHSRTLALGVGGSVVMTWLTGRGFRRHLLLVVSPIVMIGGMLAAAGLFGRVGLGARFEAYFMDRYSVLRSPGAAMEYAPEDARTAEWQAAIEGVQAWFPLGTGLGVRYADAIPGMPLSSGSFSHAAVVYLATRFGIFGLLAFGALVLALLLCAIRIRRKGEPTLGWVHQGLLVAAASLVVCSFFGNVFAVSYMVAPTMVTLGALAACEALATEPRTE